MRLVGSGCLIAAMALALGATPAHAAGTVHYDFPEQCWTTYNDPHEGDITTCYSSSAQVTTTSTKSGNLLYRVKGTDHNSYTSDHGTQSYDSDFRLQVITKNGEQQVSRIVDSVTYTLTNGTTCTIEWQFTFAGGEIRKVTFEDNCFP
jgi:hypothetical protein